MTWHTGTPPDDGAYLVTVRWMGKVKVFVDCYWEPIGFSEFHDDVLAWTILPEPWRGEKNE